ncbi:MAG: hypothetical protein FWG09_02865, partial [Synergistaceae bacterium]|nr:hypothetical protein [Synergistaceae bacterium]
WEFFESAIFDKPIPIPEAEPTVSKPFMIEGIPFETNVLKLTEYKIWIESRTNGRMKIHGELKERGVEFDLENVIWQKGTPEPDDPDNESGCNSVFGASAWLLFAIFMMAKNKSVRISLGKALDRCSK